jgi:hypothetical protein
MQIKDILSLFENKQTESPEFKSWFGDSKVVDSEGNPLVVYHGTDHVMNEFYGGFFTDNPKTADEFGSAIYPVYLRIENPAEDFSSLVGSSDKDLFALYKEYIGDDFDEEEFEESGDALRDIATTDVQGGFKEWLIDRGYDGIISFDDSNRVESVVYVPLLGPNQIKSATGNKGSFNSESDNITEARDRTGFEKWTEGLPVVQDVSSKNSDSSSFEDIGKLKRHLKHLEEWFSKSPTIESVKEDVLSYWKNFIQVLKDHGYKTVKEWIKGPKDDVFELTYDDILDKGLMVFIDESPDNEIQKAEKEWKDKKIDLDSTKEELNKLNKTIENYGVLKTGSPVIVVAYHGSSFGGFTSFSKEELGANTKAGSATLGYFFSGDPETASSYAFSNSGNEISTRGFAKLSSSAKTEVMEEAFSFWSEVHEVDEKDKDYMTYGLKDYPDEFLEEIEDSPSWFVDMVHSYLDAEGLEDFEYDTTKLSPSVYKVYVKMKNPYVHDYEGEKYREIKYYDVIKKAKTSSHDGVILLNTYDSMDSYNSKKDNIIVTFDNKNIKSATGNKGSFNPDKEDIIETSRYSSIYENSLKFTTVEDFNSEENKTQRSFLFESADTLSTLESYIKNIYNINVSMSLSENTINISNFTVPRFLRQMGVGSEAMSEIVKFADKNKFDIKMDIPDSETIQANRLRRFYKRFGFVEKDGVMFRASK